MAIDTLIPQLVINKMTQSQYDEALENGAIVGTEIYFIPSDGSDVGGGGAVASVNGQIGEVNLTAEDVGAIPVITGTQGQVVGFDANGNAVAQDAPDSGVGKNVENTVYTITDAEGNEIEVIAGVGAEVFNDYENNKASGQYAHAEGFGTTASSSKQHVQGISNIEDIENKYAHIVGNGEAAFDIYGDFTVTSRSNAHTLDWDGNAWFAGDVYVGSTSGTNKDEGSKKLATEEYVNNNSFSGDYNDLTNKPFYQEEAWAFISDTFSNGVLTVINNEDTYSNCFNKLGRYRFTINGTDIYEYEKTSSNGQFIIGDAGMQTIPFALRKVQSSGTKTLVQIVGNITVTSCKAEYYTSSAKCLDDIFLSSNIARTEDLVGVKTSYGGEVFNDITNNRAQATYAHAEGEGTTASGQASHTEGRFTRAVGNGAHAEGVSTSADGNGAHAEGLSTIASGQAQHVEGKYNIESADFIHITGNGTSTTRSNAHTLNLNGEAWFAGDVYVGSTSGVNKDEGSVKLAKEITMTGATSSAAGTSGLVPTPAAGDEDKFLKGDGTWAESGKVTSVNGSTGDVVIDASSIGAATTDHTHSGYAASSHTHAAGDITSGTFATARIPSLAASKITAGTFAGQVVANSSNQPTNSYVVRNSKISASAENPTVIGQICWKRS